MRLFLASHKFSGHEAEAKNLYKNCQKVALILNAQDTAEYAELRPQKVADELAIWQNLGVNAEELDLREYYDRPDALAEDFRQYDGVWARGGNCFELRMAMLKSGADKLIKKCLADDSIVYGGYSAGVCILGKTLQGLDLCDDITSVKKTHGSLEWSGLGVTSYTIVPHFESDHPESLDIDRVVDYLTQHNINYKTLRDDQVLLINGQKQEVLG